MKEASKKVKSEPLHSSLGLIDRVIRTIRDMAYNMEVEIITPDVMAEILKQYNHAPHKTLSKYAGFDVSPYMAQTNPDLEEFIVRRISAENYRIQSQPSFKLKPGTKVKVYNENSAMMKRRSKIQPGEYYVEEFKDGLYTVCKSKNSCEPSLLRNCAPEALVEYEDGRSPPTVRGPADRSSRQRIPRYKLAPSS